jgi:hypothetical protein
VLLGFPEGGGDAPYTGWPYTTKKSKTLLQGPGGNGSPDEVRLTPLCQQVPSAQTKTSMGCRILDACDAQQHPPHGTMCSDEKPVWLLYG